MTVQRARFDLINYRFLTTEIDLKALYIFRCFITTLSVKLFVVTLQIFVYEFLLTIVFFEKRNKKTHKTVSHNFSKRTIFGK